MVDLKKNSWILIIISAILVLISIILPSYIYYDMENGDGALVWLFGLIQYIDEGAIGDTDFFEVDSYVVTGALFFISLLICAIILILLVGLEKRGKNIPHKGMIITIIGIYFILSPLIQRSVAFGLDEMEDTTLGAELFAFFHYNSILLFLPIAGTLNIIPVILYNAGEVRNG